MKCIPWESWEEDFLREVSATMPVELIAEKLERTIPAIWGKASRMGVRLTYHMKIKPWTAQELSLFKSSTAEEIAKSTSRSIYSVRSKRYQLGLSPTAGQ